MKTPQISSASAKLEQVSDYIDKILSECKELRRENKKKLSEAMEAKEDLAFAIRHILRSI